MNEFSHRDIFVKSGSNSRKKNDLVKKVLTGGFPEMLIRNRRICELANSLIRKFVNSSFAQAVKLICCAGGNAA